MSENELATKKNLTDLKEELLGRMQRLATKEDLDQKIATLATKEELDNKVATLVTKKEFDQKVATLVAKKEFDQKIATLVTKEEFDQKIATLATKEALEVVANQGAINTRDISEMKGDIKVLKWEMGQMREDIKSLETKFDKKFDVLITAVDGIAKELMDMRTEKVATEHVLNRHETKLENHDKRIRKLELKKAS
ncbi:MAG: hypothetical protein MUC94_06815 [bacterium]|nr:hypothetical protein [bacterium]